MKKTKIILGAVAPLVAVTAARTAELTLKRKKLSERKTFRHEKESFYAERLAAMLRCKTVSVRDSYDDTEFAKLRDTLRELFPLIHKTAEIRIFGEDCYCYKIPGKDSGKNILLMSHHDVVAADGEWKYPPFDGVIAEGKLWGRGAVDTKTSLFAEFTAVEELLEKGETPDKNIWIVSSHNEELLGDGIFKAASWFSENGVEFEFAIDEGGGVVDIALAGKEYRLAMIGVHEKGRSVFICKTDKTPTEKKYKALSPAERMSGFINEVKTSKRLFARKISPLLGDMLTTIGAYLPLPVRAVTANLPLFGAVVTRAASAVDARAEQMLGTTCRFAAVRSGKYNEADPNLCEAEASFRNMNAEDLDAEMKRFRKIADKYGISLTPDETRCEYREPADTACKEYEMIKKITSEVFPDAIVSPYINPAFTDARAIMDICRKTYRFVPVAMSEQQLGSMHNPNENVSLPAICGAVEFYARVIKEA